MISAYDKLASKYFGHGIPTTSEIEQKMLLALVNTNPAMDYAAPLPENVIPVGGLHIKDPKPLPKVRSDLYVHVLYQSIDSIAGFRDVHQFFEERCRSLLTWF